MRSIIENDQSLAADNHSRAFGRRIGLIARIFGCWHKQISRPFQEGADSYVTCLGCGARRRYDAEEFMLVGAFHYPPKVVAKELESCVDSGEC